MPAYWRAFHHIGVAILEGDNGFRAKAEANLVNFVDQVRRLSVEAGSNTGKNHLSRFDE